MQFVNFAFKSYNRSGQHNTIRKRVPYIVMDSPDFPYNSVRDAERSLCYNAKKAVLIQYWRVTDIQTDTRTLALARS